MSDFAVLLLLAVGKLIFHVATDGQYGFHRDELQTFADARHLAWGYVAYPPLTPFLGHVEQMLFGTSLRGFRVFAACAQSVVFVVTGTMTKRMGGGRAAQIIAATAVAIAPVSLASSAMLQYNTFDSLWFVLMAYFVLRLVESNDARWWVAIGTTIGLSVLTKYTTAFFIAGLVAGVFATPLREHLRSKWLWIGVAVSIAIAAPNMIWQMQHGFISIDFLQHIHARDIRMGRTRTFIPDQFYIASNPFTVPLWLIGLYVVVRERRYRIFAWMYAVPIALFVVARGRGYYAGPLYPMLIAAGVAMGFSRSVFARLKPAIAVALAAGGISAAMIALPLAPIHSRVWDLAVKLNPDFVEELGWPELTGEVARIYKSIPPAERARTGIFANNYGEAGAIEAFGPMYGLPRPMSGTNSFWLRGPVDSPDNVIVLGDNREALDQVCKAVTLEGHPPNPWNVRNEESIYDPDIFLCRGLKTPLPKLWPRLGRFG